MLKPRNPSSQDAVIDIFKNVAIHVPCSWLNPVFGIGVDNTAKSSFLDFSPLLPSDVSVSHMDLKVNSLGIASAPSATLKVDPNVELLNPSNVTAKIPFAKA